MAQPVKRLTLAEVMISQLMASSPASGSVLTARSPEPASDSVSPSLSASPLVALCLSFSQKYIKMKKIQKKILYKNWKYSFLHKRGATLLGILFQRWGWISR